MGGDAVYPVYPSPMSILQLLQYFGLLSGLPAAYRHARDLALGPKIVLGLLPPATGTTMGAANAQKYRHLVVSSAHRTNPAHNVQVFLSRIAERGPDGSDKVLWAGEEVRMYWAWERNENGAPKSRTVGAPAVCDLLAVAKDTPETIRLQTIAGSWNFGHNFDLQTGRTYVATFVARADEADSEPLPLEIRWDGRWADDEDSFSLHLTVKGPPGALVV